MEQRLGYRVRPSFNWQRERYGTMELILGIANDGVAGVPGVLGIYAESLDGKVKVGGNLDAEEPRAGQIRQASLILPKGMDGQQIVLRLRRILLPSPTRVAAKFIASKHVRLSWLEGAGLQNS